MVFVIKINAQYQLTGYVQDQKSDEALIGANIYVDATQNGTSTNEYGYFSLELGEGAIEIRVSYLGYKTKVYNLDITTDTVLKILLVKENLLNEIVVKEKRSQKFQEGKVSLPIGLLSQIPTIASESDIFKSLSMFPGISTGREGTSSLFVRGGTPDENLILLDGIPVYNATHLGGYFSVINSDAIKTIDVYKGNFPARFGGRLSSVIDIQTKEGNRNETHGKIGLGVLTSNMMLEGPVSKRASYFVSGRTSYFGLINIFTDKEKVDYYFDYWLYDFNGKLNFDLKKGKLFFSAYMGNDVGVSYSNDTYKTQSNLSDEKIKWGSITLSSRYILPVTPKLFAKFLIGYSHYHSLFRLKSLTEEYFINDTLLTLATYENNSFVKDEFVQSNWDYVLNSKNHVKFGSSYTIHHFVAGSIDTISNFNGHSALASRELSMYLEDKYKLSRQIKLNIGARYSIFYTNNNRFSRIEPRFSLRYEPSKKLNFSASYSVSRQYVHLLSSNGFGFPNNIWVPPTDKIPPQDATQYSIGSGWQVSANYLVGIESYYKKMTHLIDYRSGIDPDEPPIFDWQNIVTKDGVGTAYGVESIMEKRNGKMTGFISYTLSWSFRQFKDLNQGLVFPHSYDRRHDFSVLGMYTLTSHWLLSANWIFQTGTAVSLPIASIPVPGHQYSIEVYGGRNSGRMPNYHRLDVGVEYKKRTRKNNEFKIKASIYNLYNRQNASFLLTGQEPFFDANYNQIGTRKSIEQVSMFSLIPSLSLSYKF